MTWQPIETCPRYNWLKKGPNVLVRCKVREDAYQIFQAAYDPIEKDNHRFWVPIPDNRRRKKSSLSGGKAIQQILMYIPTHWMPLPAPPEDVKMIENNTQSIPPKFNDHYQRQTIIETVTLRDQFAMAALTGILASIAAEDVMMYVRDAYRIADAMLGARKENK